jgi:hypothetical protein
MHITVITANHGTFQGDAIDDMSLEELNSFIELVAQGSMQFLQLSVDGKQVFFPNSVISQSVFIINE